MLRISSHSVGPRDCICGLKLDEGSAGSFASFVSTSAGRGSILINMGFRGFDKRQVRSCVVRDRPIDRIQSF